MLIDCGKEFETNLDTTHSIFPEKISKKIEEKERCKRQRAVLEADEPNNNNAGIGIQIEVWWIERRLSGPNLSFSYGS